MLAPEHPLVEALTAPDHRPEVEAYVEAARRRTEIERLATDKEKTGVFTGAYCVNQLNGERVPILVGDCLPTTSGTSSSPTGTACRSASSSRHRTGTEPICRRPTSTKAHR